MDTNLKVMRRAVGWSQEKASAKVGMSRAWYCLLENGRFVPNDEVKTNLEKVFGKPAEILLQPVIIDNVESLKQAIM